MNTILTTYSDEEFRSVLREVIKEVLDGSADKKETGADDTLTASQAAEFLKMKPQTLYEKTSKRLIPHFKRGNKLYFQKSELHAWIKEGKIKTSAELEGQAVVYLMNGKERRHRVKEGRHPRAA